MKSLAKSGSARTGANVTALLSASKAFVAASF